jgi:hypothetical protein
VERGRRDLKPNATSTITSAVTSSGSAGMRGKLRAIVSSSMEPVSP